MQVIGTETDCQHRQISKRVISGKVTLAAAGAGPRGMKVEAEGQSGDGVLREGQ